MEAKTKAEQNAEDMIDILGDLVSGKYEKRETLHLPPRGAFMDIIKEAEAKLDTRGRFGNKKRH